MAGRVEHLPKERYRLYRERASGLARTMDVAMQAGELHGAALSAIHAAIAAADALSIFYLGERSRGQNHRELQSLVHRLPIPGAAEQARHLTSILGRKSEAEYGSSGLSARDTERLTIQTARFLKWAMVYLPPA